MSAPNPFAAAPPGEQEDLRLVGAAKQGSREALEELVVRHQGWIYNIALRMVYHPADAEDATQEILVKVLTRIGGFEGRSAFRTWLYRIAVNHVLNMRRGRMEPETMNFADFGRSLDTAPDLDLPDPRQMPVDVQLLVDEARIGCTSGMLLCLDRGQRLVYILGEILGLSDALGAELLEVSRDNFRQRLARARRDLHAFMQDKCGLVNRANPCRCAKKTRAFMKAGYVDPENLLFARARVVQVKAVAPRACEELSALDEAYADVFRSHPFQDGPDLRRLVGDIVARRELEL